MSFKKVTQLSILLLLLAVSSGTAQTILEKKIDSLFVIASSGEVKYRDLVEPAKKAIAELGAPAVPRLIDKFVTESARERLTVIQILKEIGSPAVPDLVKALDRTDGLVVQRVCWALGDIGDSSAVMPLTNVSKHKRWQVRDQAIGALGKVGDKRGTEAVMTAFADSIGQVRKAAAVSAGKLHLEGAIPILIGRLADEFYGARMSAVHSLLGLDTNMVISQMADSINSSNPFVGSLGCYVLGQFNHDRARQILYAQVQNGPLEQKSHAAIALIESDPEDLCGYRAKILGMDFDRLTRLKIESAIADLDE